MNEAWQGRTFAPIVDEASLARRLNESSDVVRKTFVASDSGRLVGTLTTTDTDAYRRSTVLEYSARGQIIRFMLRQVSRVARHLPALPKPGTAFRCLTIHDVAVPSGDPVILRDLLRAVGRSVHGRGYHMIHIAFAGDDPLEPAVRRFPRQEFPSEIYVAVRHGCPLAVSDLDGRNPWIDLLKI